MNWIEIIFQVLGFIVSTIIEVLLALKFPQKQIIERRTVIEHRNITDESLSLIQAKEWKKFGFCSLGLEGFLLVISYLFFYFTQSELSPFDLLTQSLKAVVWWNLGILLVILFFYFKFRLFESDKKYLAVLIGGTILTTIFAISISWNLHTQNILDVLLNNLFDGILWVLLVLSFVPFVMVFFCFIYKDQAVAKKQLFIPNIVFILLIPAFYFGALFNIKK